MNALDEMRQLREELQQKEARLKQLEEENFDVFGVWKVTTEGDEEGRTTKDLGTHSGNIFDIVKKLSDQSFYKLRVERVGHYKPNEKDLHKKHSVNFSIEDKSIKMHNEEDQIKKLTPYLPEGHRLSDSQYFGAIKLEWIESKVNHNV
ncbi:hypothetical protein PP175_28980 (plasmid) [Aneurinibacillus sp. Ricciae_BoGa-3]|uniref:hypothetical protein n=1 Tax=Aneurinibacillus sp. Ricciae_BoGa-3 TaxID=3022697 RepID=UPI00234011CE|nr:hypothetical protein [Aneurinibacillus sp. Ricciae_BoGa-3]WCK57226.1 hypothetical protein PP175_28980 [Aneurinibacillus sp. Ricciae_BoGa-3]